MCRIVVGFSRVLTQSTAFLQNSRNCVGSCRFSDRNLSCQMRSCAPAHARTARTLPRELTNSQGIIPSSTSLPFFDLGSEEHALWSVLTFKTWVTVYKPHVHAESGTVFSRPLGICNLIFAASQMHQNIDFAKQHKSPPWDLLQVIQGPR
jgi:hypothetical protein